MEYQTVRIKVIDMLWDKMEIEKGPSHCIPRALRRFLTILYDSIWEPCYSMTFNLFGSGA